jgi:hypothetical protein
MEAKIEKKLKKKIKRKNKNKKLQITKKRAQVSLTQDTDEVNNQHESGTTDQPLGYNGTEGVPQYEFPLVVDENNNTPKLEKNDSSLVKPTNSPLLINLDDSTTGDEAQEHVRSNAST